MLKPMKHHLPIKYKVLHPFYYMNTLNYNTVHFGNDWGLFVDLENIGKNNKVDNLELMVKKYNIQLNPIQLNPIQLNPIQLNNTVNKNECLKLNNLHKKQNNNNIFIHQLFLQCLNKMVILGTSIAFSYCIFYAISIYC